MRAKRSSPFAPRRLLVTGGCGFIGSNFVRHILQTDPEVEIVNLDALTYCGNPENLPTWSAISPDRYRFMHGDIRDPEAVREAMAGCDSRGSFRRGEPRGPLHRMRGRLHHHQRVGHLRAARGSPAARPRAVRPRLHRRGLRLHTRGFVLRG